MPSDVHSRLGKTADKLNGTEQRMVNALLDRRQERVFLSGPQLAARLEVLGAAPTRLAQKLGYKGCPELRSVLQKDMLKARGAALRRHRPGKAVAEGNDLSDLI